jgi:hypothetical protein
MLTGICHCRMHEHSVPQCSGTGRPGQAGRRGQVIGSVADEGDSAQLGAKGQAVDGDGDLFAAVDVAIGACPVRFHDLLASAESMCGLPTVVVCAN